MAYTGAVSVDKFSVIVALAIQSDPSASGGVVLVVVIRAVIGWGNNASLRVRRARLGWMRVNQQFL